MYNKIVNSKHGWEYGTVGDKTDLVDYVGNKLLVGDVVAIRGAFKVVVKDKHGRAFIMGECDDSKGVTNGITNNHIRKSVVFVRAGTINDERVFSILSIHNKNILDFIKEDNRLSMRGVDLVGTTLVNIHYPDEVVMICQIGMNEHRLIYVGRFSRGDRHIDANVYNWTLGEILKRMVDKFEIKEMGTW